jgi:menaquinone-dependent protoporphyrinogen IX oxidase
VENVTILPGTDDTVKVFPVGGRYVFNRMSFIDRNIIKLVAFFSKHQETKEGMLTEKDDVKRENLREVLDYLNIR